MDANTKDVLMSLVPAVLSALGSIAGAYWVFKAKMAELSVKVDDVKKEVAVVKTQTDGIQSELIKAVKGQSFGEGQQQGQADERLRQEGDASGLVATAKAVADEVRRKAKDEAANLLTAATRATEDGVLPVETRTEAEQREQGEKQP